MAGEQTLIYYIKRIHNANQCGSGRLLLNRGCYKRKRGSSQTNALYMFARSLALTCAAVIPVCRNAPTILFVATMAMLIVQIVDCIIGIVIKSKMRTVGPFIMAVCHAVCLLLSI